MTTTHKLVSTGLRLCSSNNWAAPANASSPLWPVRAYRGLTGLNWTKPASEGGFKVQAPNLRSHTFLHTEFLLITEIHVTAVYLKNSDTNTRTRWGHFTRCHQRLFTFIFVIFCSWFLQLVIRESSTDFFSFFFVMKLNFKENNILRNFHAETMMSQITLQHEGSRTPSHRNMEKLLDRLIFGVTGDFEWF